LSNGKCIWLHVSTEEQVYSTADILLEICIKAIPTNSRLYVYLCLISMLNTCVIS